MSIFRSGEWAAYFLDVMYPVMSLVMCVTGIFFLVLQGWGGVFPALIAAVGAGCAAACIRYRLRAARYYLGKYR